MEKKEQYQAEKRKRKEVEPSFISRGPWGSFLSGPLSISSVTVSVNRLLSVYAYCSGNIMSVFDCLDILKTLGSITPGQPLLVYIQHNCIPGESIN